MQNLSGCRRAASTASTFTASPSALGGCSTAQSTPADAISASASSAEYVGICRWCALILPCCQRWIWESTISMALLPSVAPHDSRCPHHAHGVDAGNADLVDVDRCGSQTLLRHEDDGARWRRRAAFGLETDRED